MEQRRGADHQIVRRYQIACSPQVCPNARIKTGDSQVESKDVESGNNALDEILPVGPPRRRPGEIDTQEHL
jgi:hypothetical protein